MHVGGTIFVNSLEGKSWLVVSVSAFSVEGKFHHITSGNSATLGSLAG